MDQDFRTLLHTRGYRCTAQRQLVLDHLRVVGGHATADDIYEQVSGRAASINRATVYRTLRFLCDIGVVTSTTVDGGHLAYELAPSEPHHHLICGVCGYDQTMEHDMVTPLRGAIAASHGFSVGPTLHLTLFGVCKDCRDRKVSAITGD